MAKRPKRVYINIGPRHGGLTHDQKKGRRMAAQGYTDMHRPWEPMCIDQVYELVNVKTVRKDYLLRLSIENLYRRGFARNDAQFGQAVINMCQSADAILEAIMRDAK